MIENLESLAGTRTAIITTWALALMVFMFWLNTEFRGMAFTSLIRWKSIILKSLRIGLLVSLLLPPILIIVGSFAGPWVGLVVFFGMSYLPPSVYILGTSLGGFYSISRFGKALTPTQKKYAYATVAAMAAMGCAMLYVSMVWLDRPV